MNYLDSDDEYIDIDSIVAASGVDSQPQLYREPDITHIVSVMPSLSVSQKTTTPTKLHIKLSMEILDSGHFSITNSSIENVINIYKRNNGVMELNDENKPYWKIPIQNYFATLRSLQSPYNTFYATVEPIPQFIVSAFLAFKPIPTTPNTFNSLSPRLLNRLLPHQRESALFAVSRGYRVLIADDMGLGKTLQAVTIACLYGFPSKRVLVACPNNLVSSWTDTFGQWTSIAPSRINVVTKLVTIPDNPLTIATYPTIARSDGLFNEYNFDMVIADECHEFSNQSTRLFQNISPIIKRSKAVIMLSGTPSLNRPAELFSQLTLLLPNIFKSFHEYSRRYCQGGITKFGHFAAGGSTHPNELRAVLEHLVMIRRQKEDVLTGLPPKTRTHIYIPYSPSEEMRQRVEQMRVQRIGIESGLQSSKTAHRGLVLEAISMTAVEKIDPILSWLGTAQFRSIFFGNDAKFLFFAHHLKVLKAIQGWFEKAEIGTIMISGSTTMDRRAQLIDQFRNDPGTRVAVLGIETISAGVTLIEANVVIFAELMCVPALHLQAEDRVHRIGQTKPVSVYYLHARGSVDDRLWEILDRKLQILGAIIVSNTSSLD